MADLLRFITCGSVDDGKSTLIGRLLHETGALFQDQIEALARDSRRHGTQGEAIDYALALDGLDAEREQGITIDVAYRFFGTPRRRFIVADCPGHEQYTRNMATGASNADLAVVLVDASKGLLTQTRRHSYIVALMGIGKVVLAVNKMDRVGYAQAVFESIAGAYRELAGHLGIAEVHAIPVSALAGDNVTRGTDAMPWYLGPTLLDVLERVEPAADAVDDPFRMPVQLVTRFPIGKPHSPRERGSRTLSTGEGGMARGYAGTIAAGRVAVGDAVSVEPSGRRSTITHIVAPCGEVERAVAGQAVTLCLADEVDASRGDVIAGADAPPAHSDQFAVHLLSLSSQALLPGRPYWLRQGSVTAGAQITEIKHRVDVNTQDHLAAKRLELNEVAYCNLALDRQVAFEPYATSKPLGSFILIDRISLDTVACGSIDFGLRRGANVHWQKLSIDRDARAAIKGQHPRCLWFTGLSGAGKSTVANLVDRRLHAAGYHTYLLDGDNVRHGLNKDLGFTPEDRVENIRRVAEVARLMVDAGLIVLVSFISPYRSERRMARELFGPDEFMEVFVDAPLALCEQRDTKGLYAKARAGKLPNFTGIDAPYEAPEQAEVHLDTGCDSAEESATRVMAALGIAPS
ncbi:MAG TPA: adenylyl-sulfate kinase [Xanthomonadaceae bacterium]|nr:adenylyl-sulfate kinase [Xanthomonadaceae bacterium]